MNDQDVAILEKLETMDSLLGHIIKAWALSWICNFVALVTAYLKPDAWAARHSCYRRIMLLTIAIVNVLLGAGSFFVASFTRRARLLFSSLVPNLSGQNQKFVPIGTLEPFRGAPIQTEFVTHGLTLNGGAALVMSVVWLLLSVRIERRTWRLEAKGL